MSRRILAAGLAAALGFGGSACHAEAPSVFAKRNAKAADLARDEAECRDLAAKAHYLGPTGTMSRQYGLTGQVIEAVAVASENANARSQGLAVCMRRRGYAKLALNAEEARAYGALSSPAARDAWTEAFVAGDIDARIKLALTPKVPPLPTAADAAAPYVVGAVRIDPGSLALAPGPMTAGGDILTGKARLRRTAVAKAEIRERTGLALHKHPAGTVFQEYLEPVPWDPSVSEERTAWCTYLAGPYFECIRSTFDGYEVAFGYGQPWLVGHADGSNVYTHPWTNPITLEVQPDDPSPSLDFHLRASKVTKDEVVLSATADRYDVPVEIWGGALKFDAHGEARLPLWDRTLVLTHEDKVVRATFEPRSDGKGLMDAP